MGRARSTSYERLKQRRGRLSGPPRRISCICRWTAQSLSAGRPWPRGVRPADYRQLKTASALW